MVSQSAVFARALSALGDADEARWALYYGVKALAKSTVPGSGSFEAKLFYNFLDERYGEDELTFFLYWYVLFASFYSCAAATTVSAVTLLLLLAPTQRQSSHCVAVVEYAVLSSALMLVIRCSLASHLFPVAQPALH